MVQHLEGGVVAEIAVKEGDSVTAGDLLLQLDITHMETQRAITESQLYELMARRGRLEAERYARAKITLKPGEQAKLGDDQVLLPGMPVEAFIRTSDRSPLAYFIKPMMDYFNRAFRES